MTACLARAATATRGMGYAIQSAGWHMWELSGAPGGPVGADHVERAIAAMEQDVGCNVVAPVWNCRSWHRALSAAGGVRVLGLRGRGEAPRSSV